MDLRGSGIGTCSSCDATTHLDHFWVWETHCFVYLCRPCLLCFAARVQAAVDRVTGQSDGHVDSGHGNSVLGAASTPTE